MESTLLSWCQRIVQCPSVTTDGTRRIAELCATELLAPRGINARLIASAHEGSAQVNLIAMIAGRDHTAAPLVLNTHLDTVPPGDNALWTCCGGNPFAATVADGRIYGLGAADTKLDFIAKVFALADTPRPRRDVHLVATFGEEHGLAGAREIVAGGLLPPGALAFVGEASQLEVITAHKGLMAFQLELSFKPRRADPGAPAHRLVFTGRSAHSSTPALGRNAIIAALNAMAAQSAVEPAAIAGGDAVNKVPARCEVLVVGYRPELSGSLKTATAESESAAPATIIPRDAVAALAAFVRALGEFADGAGPAEPDYAPPTLTCNPGVIRSEAGVIVLEFELRPPPSLALGAVRDGVAAIVAQLKSDFPAVAFTLTELRANPGFRSRAESETVEIALAALARAGLALQTGVKAGCTEAGVYASAGLHPVVIGPGPSTGVIHAPNEYNFLAEVEGALRFYRELLEL